MNDQPTTVYYNNLNKFEILQKQLAKCKQQISQQGKQIEDLKNKVAVLQGGNERNSLELSEISWNFNELQNERDFLLRQNREFQMQVGEMNNKDVEIKKLLGDAQKENSRLNAIITRLWQKENSNSSQNETTEPQTNESAGEYRFIIPKTELIQDPDDNPAFFNCGRITYVPNEDVHESPVAAETNSEGMETDVQTKKFVCTFPGCNKQYNHKKTLSEHCIMAHETELCAGVKSYHCTVPGCGQSFRSKKTLISHGLSHVVKPFQCSFDGCSEGFDDEKALEDHLAEHSKKTFVCPLNCGRSFATKTNLNAHMHAHAGRKRFACPYPGCGKMFSRLSNCTKHKSCVHDGVRPFECEFEGCGRSFLTKYDRQIHSYSHTGEKHFKCHICQNEYHSSGGLHRHMVIVHNIRNRRSIIVNE